MAKHDSSKLDPSADRAALIARFAGTGGDYYTAAFERLDAERYPRPQFNPAAALSGTFWWAMHRMWAHFWLFALVEGIAVVQIVRGAFGELGRAELARAERLATSAAQRQAEADAAVKAAADNAEGLARSAEALKDAAARAMVEANAVAAGGVRIVVVGLAILLAAKLLQGFLANPAMKRRFQKWRADPRMPDGIDWPTSLGMGVFAMVAWAATAFRFAFPERGRWLRNFPSSIPFRRDLESRIDGLFEWLTRNFSGFFEAITHTIRVLLDGMETLMVGTPWPVAMGAIVLVAYGLAGTGVAVFTVASLAYLGFLGFWDKAMMTIALLGSACFVCLIVGIPLGVWCARRPKVRAVVWPILDLMQTLPSFVYLIPVVAFFGIGKPPGIIATMVFGMPPVVRLTVLGFDGIPPSVREAAMSFGASKLYMLFRVDLPLAKPSIMAGVNQTVMMCLSMVVVASLIGAKGLGEDVLDALTYANEGKGVLAGIAILLCAIVLDRVVQGRSRQR